MSCSGDEAMTRYGTFRSLARGRGHPPAAAAGRNKTSRQRVAAPAESNRTGKSPVTETTINLSQLGREVARRRTFAIISHPDAGKTTLTEKLLLYGGAIDVAGAVRARRAGRHATSDWMAMEQTRGISITSTALQFEYDGY